jgi:uncharacterized protein (TIGR00251 family)
MSAILLVGEEGITLNIYVQPGANKDQFAGKYLARLKVKVQAKAIDGAANESVCQFVAVHFGVSRKCVQILRGINSRQKTVQVLGNPVLLRATAEKLID